MIKEKLPNISLNLDEANGVFVEYLPNHILLLLNYFEENYVGRLNRRGTATRSPMFPPDVWNVYDGFSPYLRVELFMWG